MRDRTRVRARFWVEAAFAVLAAALMLLTYANAEWIEWLTGTDPDAGSGSLERTVVLACFLAAIVAGALARCEWRRALLSA